MSLLDNVIGPIAATVLASTVAAVGWIISRVISHGARIERQETAMKGVVEQLTRLNDRAGRTEDAHRATADALSALKVSTAALEERSKNQADVLGRIDRRLEDLFQPKAAAKARVAKLQDD